MYKVQRLGRDDGRGDSWCEQGGPLAATLKKRELAGLFAFPK